jgi:hypothetical protein
MARDRFGFLERHGFVAFVFGSTHEAADTASFGRPFVVALTPVWDLLLFANNLFVAAKIVWHEVQPTRAEREANSVVVGRNARP